MQLLLIHTEDVCSEEEEDRDPMTKVRLLVDASNEAAAKAFIPCQGLSIDESMCPYKGNFCYRQFIQNKRNRYGIKFWTMCCGTTNYVLKNSVYTGGWNDFDETSENDQLKQSGKVVKHLVKDLWHTGHIIFIDNYYTAVEVCDYLSRKGLGCVGALRTHRNRIPGRLKSSKKTGFPAKERGDPVYWVRDGAETMVYPMVCIAWWDKKPIAFLSNVYSSRVIQKQAKSKEPSRRIVKMPEIVLEYNYNMGGVDSSDQKKKSYAYPHPGKKWYLHMYHYLVETAMANSHVTYNDLRVHYRDKVTALAFRLELIEGLFGVADMMERSEIRDMTDVPDSAHTRFVLNNGEKKAQKRLTGRHFVQKLESKGFQGNRCVVCTARKERRRTKFFCPDCDVHLCPDQCFKIFHTVENYAEIC